jgi:hypothetical protein
MEQRAAAAIPSFDITPSQLKEHMENHHEHCFGEAEYDIVDALGLTYFNSGVHRYAQHRQFQLPAEAPGVVEEEVMQDLE